MSDSFHPSGKSYGQGAARHVVCTVVNRKDPEQSGRLQVRVVGYQDDEAKIPKEDLIWARCLFPTTNPMVGGVGGPVSGALEGTVMYGFFQDDQQLMLTYSLGKAGKPKENGELDQSGTNHDTPKVARTEATTGGDYRWDEKKKDYGEQSVVKYARDESPNAFGSTNSRDASEQPSHSFSLAQHKWTDV